MKTTLIKIALIAVLGLTGLAGCSTPATRIHANPEAFARLSPEQQALVRAGQIGLGFDADAVKLALGEPDRIAIRTEPDGETVIWHYTAYEAVDGRILFSGFYHTRRAWWGWGAAYPYYLDYPDRRVRDRFRVEFKGGRVASITKELTR